MALTVGTTVFVVDKAWAEVAWQFTIRWEVLSKDDEPDLISFSWRCGTGLGSDKGRTWSALLCSITGLFPFDKGIAVLSYAFTDSTLAPHGSGWWIRGWERHPNASDASGWINFFLIDNVWYDSVWIRYLSGIVTVVFWYYTVDTSLISRCKFFFFLRPYSKTRGNPANPPKGYGFGEGSGLLTQTHTLLYPTHNPLGFENPW